MPPTNQRPANATPPRGFVSRPAIARPVAAPTPAAQRGEGRSPWPEYASSWADPYSGWKPRAGQVPMGSGAAVAMNRTRLGVSGLVTGLGATGTEIGTKVTGTAASIAGANTTAIAGALGVAVPVVGIAIAGIALAVTTWLNRMGPKQKRWTTQIADEATAQLQAIKRAYFEAPYNPANQAAALDLVDQMFAAISEGCGQAQMGEPGRRCIAERLVRGGSAPWCPTGTGCDYYTEYRDPIANDPRAAQWVGANTLPAATNAAQTIIDPVTGAITTALTGAATMANSAYVPLGLGLVAVWLLVRGLKG